MVNHKSGIIKQLICSWGNGGVREWEVSNLGLGKETNIISSSYSPVLAIRDLR